ncbi:syntaxin-7 [Bicyclus anynana]|uniref:Syntaxin-7 n=1 Tax=Bicyclus anynana TaxID=110368 RepID=A0A6J1NSQ8_BICAN|nr:syntaxin-7 [Bicyclus anynana]XP_023949799.1 syntaxin-7 [Bicyclus anynana]
MEASYQGGVSYESNDSFQRITQTIASNIKKISQNVLSMNKMINQLQTPQDSQELRNQLRQIQNYTQKLAKDTSTMIMELMKMPTDAHANKLTRDRLRDEYMATLNAFQATQKTAAQKTKEDVRKAKANSGISLPDPFSYGDRAESGEAGRVRSQQLQLAAQSETELQELQERERDIRQLENDILDVNSIFKELGTMIHEQGAVVSSIESSVEYAAQDVEAATRELNTAATYKNKLRKKKIYLAIILIIVIAIILIILFAH